MRKPIPLPPIAVEERPERLSLVLPTDLKRSIEAFSDYFSSTSGSVPTSFNAVIVGVLTGYLQGHRGYQKWLKSTSRASAAPGDVP